MVFRVAQESVRNAQRHAEATVLTVRVALTPEPVVLTRTDNGRDFDPRKGAGEGHVGMRLLADLATEAGGTVVAGSRDHRVARGAAMTDPVIRVLLADDHQLVRSGRAALLAGTEDIEVVGTAANGAEAVEMACASVPHVVLMDLALLRQGGLANKQIARARDQPGHCQGTSDVRVPTDRGHGPGAGGSVGRAASR
jgi:Response regulator receiver domain